MLNLWIVAGLLLAVKSLLCVVAWNLLVYDSSLGLLWDSLGWSNHVLIYCFHAAAETAPNSKENNGDVYPVDNSHDVQHDEQRVHVDLLVFMDALAAGTAGITVNFNRGIDCTDHRDDVK
jgi:hypothetical protein